MGSVFPVALPNSSRNPTGSEQPGVYHQPLSNIEHIWVHPKFWGKSLRQWSKTRMWQPADGTLGCQAAWLLPKDPHGCDDSSHLILLQTKMFFVSHDSVYAPCSCLTPLVFVGLTNSSSSCSLVNGNVHCFFHVCPSHFPIKNLFFWTAKSSSLALALEWSRSTLQKIVCRFSRLDKILCRTQGDILLIVDPVKDISNWIIII